MEYRTTLSANGRVQIPVALRKLMHLKAGVTLVLRLENDELHLSSLKHTLEKAQSAVSHYAKNTNLVEKLNSLRQEDNKHE